MPKYKVTIKRTFEEYADIEVEAEDKSQARLNIKILAGDLPLSWSDRVNLGDEIQSCELIKE